MNLTHPCALLWLLLAVPLVVFYVLKFRLRRVPVSTVLFWRQIFDEKKPRSLWQRLRHLVSLLVQLVLLGFMISALTEPFFSGESLNRRRVVLVLDTSAGMLATDVAPDRFAVAREKAHEVIKGLRFRDEMAIVEAGVPPRVACGLTGHARTLRESLDAVVPADGPATLTEAIALARRLADGSDTETRVVVVTDGCGDQLPKLLADEEKKPAEKRLNLTVIRVGERTANVGITRLQVRRSPVDPVGYETLLEVQNFADEPANDIRLVLTLNGKTLDVIPLTLKPNEVFAKVIESTTADGGALVAELSAIKDGKETPYADALAADNSATAFLPKREKIPVHLHAPKNNLFLQMVLAANPLVTLTTSRELPKDTPAATIKVYHVETPAVLPPGNVLIVEPGKDCNLYTLGATIPLAMVVKQDKESSILAHVRLDNVTFPDARTLTFLPGEVKPQVLLTSIGGEPLMTLFDRPEGKVVVLTGDLDKGELPFRTAFPILVTNTLGLFVGGAGELRESLATGSVTALTLPPGECELRGPDGSVRKLPATTGKTTLGPFDRVGLWTVTGPAGTVVETFAVNLMSKTASDLRPADLPAAVTNPADAGLVGGYGGRPVWWYLVAAAFALAGLEWYLYQRRWIS